MSENQASGYTVHAFSASGALLGLDGIASAGQPRTGVTGDAAGKSLFVRTGFRAGNKSRTPVRFYVVTDPCGYREAHGRPAGGGLVRYLPGSEGQRTAFNLTDALSAPQEDAEPVKAPAPRTSAAESPRGPRVTVKTSTGAERVNDTTPERLTVGSDNPKGEPVYVKTLPERHHVHRGRTVLDVFGHDGYWFTVPGNFPASLPEEFHLSRMTLAVFQSPDVVPGFLVWVVRQTTGAAPNLGTSAESRRAAVRSALARLSTSRMQRARRIVENRAAINSRPTPAPVRVTAGDAGWVVHVRCACEHLDGAENFPSVATAAREWVNKYSGSPGGGYPAAPWELCAHSPRAFTSIAGLRYTITGTGRTAAGDAVINGMGDDGHTASLWLAGARENSL